MSFLTDMDQDDRIARLERKIRQIENKNNGGNEMSKIIKDLVGMDCTLDVEYSECKCTIVDVDEDWVKIIEHEKKKDTTKIIRIDSIDSITLD